MKPRKNTHVPVSIQIPYGPPVRNGKRTALTGGVRWEIDIDHPEMKRRAEMIMRLDPMLPPEDVVDVVYETYTNFLCHCGRILIRNGQNGAGTPSFRCKTCKKNMSIWNTFELTLWRYKKSVCGALTTMNGLAVQTSSELFGIGKGALTEVAMSLPTVKYSKTGELEILEYDGKRYGIVTNDMIYKGRKGVMLGICGGLSTTTLGNENTGEGLQEFFDDIEKRVGTDHYVFIMDMRLNVAKMILERWGEHAIIILQNHTVWGDVQVYFYYNGWYTLRLRTDAFTEPSMKRREEALLGVGEIELYEGLKGVTPRISLKSVTDGRLKETAGELLTQLLNTDWGSDGRVDLVMRQKLVKLNALLKELDRRGVDLRTELTILRSILEGLVTQYAHTIKKMTKKKIINAWRVVTFLKEEVNHLSEQLLKEPLPSKEKKPPSSQSSTGKATKNDHWVKFIMKPRLLYRGPLDNGQLPAAALWILGLLRLLFEGKEITNNRCEGRFGVIGLALRQGRSIQLDRALTKVHLQSEDLASNLAWLHANYPLPEMGRRGDRGSRTQIKVGHRYHMGYVNRRGEHSERDIDVLSKKRKTFTAHCHEKDMVLTFRRSRVKYITLVSPIECS